MENAVLEAMKTRRSCRAFTDRQVPKELLQEILSAGQYAPSGMNRQPNLFLAVQDAETVALLSALNAKVLGSNADPFYGAKTVIVVLTDSKVPTAVEDGSLAMGNLLLAAHALGLGACWIHRAREVFSSGEGRALLQKLGIPETYQGIGNCVIGYQKEGGCKPAVPRKDNILYL